ncbi:hypothetical protein IMG5_122320 [Ichthyophthirius multifiliis]|uniref:Uncharacterized protein n=1 Tax=Ichthyophthirius multifiliis TaxID=5932 RepID=G0QV99_ICHMU|nr:hypothetical protein IMG5_122320 [Ichthyophthirius multifiliis]EGR30857.1 hypothetical protein IMG5_122320 [Ichthyophthirius multifiliis]|eukprot:XP_004032444.1 hypothetical protein IMG5_122320 [Ichthyophthirius multifiliis]
MDVWDGEDYQPVVLYGYTLNSRVLLKDCFNQTLTRSILDYYRINFLAGSALCLKYMV